MSSQEELTLELYASRSYNHGHLDKAGLIRSVIDSLGRGFVVRRLCPENVLDKCLRIAVVEREPTRLNLHHHPVTWQKDVICSWQSKFVEQRLP